MTTDSANINRQKKLPESQRFAKLKELQCQHTSRPKIAAHLILPNRTKTFRPLTI